MRAPSLGTSSVNLPSRLRHRAGKYAGRFPKGSNVVVLDPDVAQVFTDSESVNQALRALAGIILHESEKALP
jgi:hypothetical protein